MKDFLRAQLERHTQRLNELDFLLSREDIMKDMTQFMALSREHTEVATTASRYARYQQREADLQAAQQMLQDGGDDADMRAMAEEEITSAQAELVELEAELQRMLLPKDPDDARPAFIEIRAGTGGDESALFAADLLRMYLRYAERQGWRTEIVSESQSELGGYKEVVVRMDGGSSGDGVYGWLKFESGGHRVQRVPATESQGRIHTSACTVAVMPEPDEAAEVTLNPARPRPSRSTRLICVSTLSAPVVRAVSTSTKQTRPCASPTYPRASWPNAKTAVASTATKHKRCAC
jgi:peptide chain release factor 1